MERRPFIRGPMPDGALTTCPGPRARAWREATRALEPEGKLWNPTIGRLLEGARS